MEHELRSDDVIRHAFDTHAFPATALTGDDRYRTLWNVERVGQNVDQLSVCRTIHGRGMKPDEPRVTTLTRNAGSVGARDDPNVHECIGQVDTNIVSVPLCLRVSSASEVGEVPCSHREDAGAVIV